MHNLGFFLYDVSRMMRKRFDAAAKHIGVTNQQWRMLLLLSRLPGLNQGQLADVLEVEPITTCRMVDRLEQAGLVERRRDPADRRAWQIFTTESASPIIERLQGVATDVLEQAVIGIGNDEQEMMVKLLEHIRANLADDKNFELREVRNG